MPVTLDEAKQNATDDVDVQVIDEFRKESVLLDSLIFNDVVNPAGDGDTLTYTYRRLVTQPTAAFRRLNTEYAPSEVKTQRYSVDLAVLGGSFEVDRVISRIGPAASNAVTLNMTQKIKAARTTFQDAVINGDTAADEDSFDGLDKALSGSSTEFRLGAVTNWTDFDTDPRAEQKALDILDEWLSLLDGAPSLVIGNSTALARVRALARRAGQYTRDPVDGLIGANGRPIVRESYGGITFVDPGERAGSSAPIIPIENRTVGGTAATGLTDLYAVRIGLDGFHGVATVGGQLVNTWLPDFSSAGAVKKGEVEMGPVGVVLKATKAASVFRNIKVR
ncbi:phage capsid protein [Streptomyces sp. MBT65]|uniref:major capsid protein n=1 Tax=unclassified Streptomyces TaxID=2593676 RepID=UPI00190A8C5B|nr:MULTISPECIES: phage capsid protein [unclassified Streptomyces]MBK3576131.1 phage capsid protein [Streptomyces sp. MBT65]MBK3635194.1 phage capsid protein [Streptomyces sp. MBT97]